MKRMVSFLLVCIFIFAGTSMASVQRSERPMLYKANPEVTKGPEIPYALASLSESFEGVTFPPAGWTTISLDGGTGWNRQTSGTTPIPGWNGGTITTPTGGGSAVAFATWTTGGASSNDQWLVTPQLSNVVAGDSLRFWLRLWPNSYADTIYVLISTTGSASGDFTIPVATFGFAVGGDTNWNRYAFNLLDFVSSGSNIYIAFREKIADNLNDGSSFSLDRVEVGAPATKDIQVASVLLSPGSPTAGQPVTVSAVIQNNGSEPNPASVQLTYKVGSVPGSSGDGTAQTFSPSWTGNADTVTFTTTHTPGAAGQLIIGARAFYAGDLVPVNDSASATVTVNPSGTILSQDFTSATFPPTGWTLLDEPTVRWSRLTATQQPNGLSGPAARYNFFSASAGEIDTLLSPAVDLTGLGSVSLEFWHAKRAYTGGETDTLIVMVTSDGGATWEILMRDGDPTLSTGAPTSSNYTPTLASEWVENVLTIPAPYMTSNVQVAFVAKSDFGNQLWIDDIAMTQDLVMTYVSSTTTQNTALVLQGATEQQIIGIQVVTSGALSPISVTQLNLNTNGTTSTSNISNAKVFYTGTTSVFSAVNQFGSTVASPSGSFNVTGTQALANGTNYFWLTYDIAGGATLGNVVDAECVSVTVGSAQTPTVTAPAGSRTITGAMAAGDYTVGLAAFNEATGKNLRHERFTRMVRRAVSTETAEVAAKQVGQPDVAIASSLNVATRFEEVQEEYWMLTENGIPYTGSLVASSSSTESAMGIYATITAAFADLNVRGVSGHVRLLLVDASYPSETYPLTINITGLAPSASATVTVKPATGVTPSVTGSFAGPIFRIVNTNYVTFDGSNALAGSTRDWTITNSSVTTPNVIHVGSVGVTPITNVTIKNCVLINGAQTSSAVVVGSGTTVGDSGYFNTFTLENNSIQRAFIGAYINGGTSPAKGINVVATQNDLNTSGANSIRRIGLYGQGLDGADFSQNNIANFEGVNAEDDRGIWFATGTINSTAQRNEIYNMNYTGTGGYAGQGIAVSSATAASNNTIKNNFLYNLSGDGWNYTTILADNPIGIFIFSVQSGVKVYNNSINMYGNTLNQTNAHAMGIAVGLGTSGEIKNNIVSNSLGLLAALGYGTSGIYFQDSLGADLGASSLDNNVYHVNPSGSGAINVAKTWSTNHTTLGSWQTASGQEGASVSGDPLFVGASDLHVSSESSPASNAGVSLGAVTDDFDGNVRGGTPDIGADEFAGAAINVSIAAGWNLISNPVITAEDSVKELYPTSLFDYGFEFGPGGYAQARTMSNGKGYWGKFGAPTVQSITGASNTLDTIPVNAGWNLLGSLSQDIDTSQVDDPAGIRSSVWFGYSSGYFTATDIVAGSAYWVKASTAGNLIFSTAPAPDRPVQQDPLAGLSRITIVDKNGASQVLYFGTERSTVDASMYNMPPMPPAGAFDARFASADGGTMVHTHAAEAGVTIPVTLQADAYPVTIRWSMEDGAVYDLVSTTESVMRGEGSVVLKQAGSIAVRSTNSLGADGLPTAYALYQNYPNPFNPSTTIRFALPVNSRVVAEVYNALGQRVKVLVNSELSAGYHSVEWNGRGNGEQALGSGVYFVRLNATSDAQRSFSDVRKLMLLK